MNLLSETVPAFALTNTWKYTTIKHCLIPDTVWFQKCVAKEIMVPEVQVIKREGEPSEPQKIKTETFMQVDKAGSDLGNKGRGRSILQSQELQKVHLRSSKGAASRDKASRGRFLQPVQREFSWVTALAEPAEWTVVQVLALAMNTTHLLQVLLCQELSLPHLSPLLWCL